jgi:hypothetical protein
MSTTSIHEAAAELLRQIRAPAGVVNTMPGADSKGRAIIRVLVDPLHWSHIEVPTTYRGYRVVAEKRQPSLAQR